MPPDPAALRQTDLLALVNGTPMGAVLTRARLRRQIDAAGRRVADARGRLNLLRYLRWLILEVERPRPDALDYAEARRRQAGRRRAAVKAAQDIGPLPDVADPDRRAAANASLRTFAETYFASTFYLPWSPDHLQVIATLERVVRHGGQFALAMPRGVGKSCLARTAALWAILAGHRRYVCLIAATRDLAGDMLLGPIRMALCEAHDLAADYPESVGPFMALENSSKRQLQQHVAGRLTHIHWGDTRIIAATIAPDDLPPALRAAGLTASPAAGSVISATSLDAHIRGQHHARPDGVVVRPDLVILDDPQTRESARSPEQTDFRLQLINGDAMYLAGPDTRMAAVACLTKIYPGDLSDQLLDRDRSPQWQGQTYRMVQRWPRDSRAWQRYQQIYLDGLRAGDDGRAATAWYAQRRAAMDAGAEVAWPHQYDREHELSALQHAHNLKALNEEAFWAEYQNDPRIDAGSPDTVEPAAVARRGNGRPRATAPPAATHLTAYVDPGTSCIWWCLCAWQADFTGYVVDYGTWPPQRRRWFTARQPPRPLGRQYRGRGADGAILAGLADLLPRLLATEITRPGTAPLRPHAVLIDCGYKPALIPVAIRRLTAGAVIMPSRGVGVTAGRKPMTSYKRRPGERHGHHWYVPNTRGTAELPTVTIDTNWWKSYVHAALATAPGDPGALTLWGRSPATHELFAQHVAASETWTETFGHGRCVHEWRHRPSKPDNHWFDCLVGCTAAASYAGVATAATTPPRPARPRKRYTQEQLSAGRTPWRGNTTANPSSPASHPGEA